MKRLASLFTSVCRCPGSWLRRNWLIGLACALAAASGCSRLRPLAAKPQAEIKSLLGGGNPAPPLTPTQLQGEVMRFADDYAGRVAQAADDVHQHRLALERGHATRGGRGVQGCGDRLLDQGGVRTRNACRRTSGVLVRDDQVGIRRRRLVGEETGVCLAEHVRHSRWPQPCYRAAVTAAA